MLETLTGHLDSARPNETCEIRHSVVVAWVAADTPQKPGYTVCIQVNLDNLRWQLMYLWGTNKIPTFFKIYIYI